MGAVREKLVFVYFRPSEAVNRNVIDAFHLGFGVIYITAMAFFVIASSAVAGAPLRVYGDYKYVCPELLQRGAQEVINEAKGVVIAYYQRGKILCLEYGVPVVISCEMLSSYPRYILSDTIKKKGDFADVQKSGCTHLKSQIFLVNNTKLFSFM